MTGQTMVYTLADLFSGAGGFTQGFVQTARFRSVFAIDCEKDAVETYKRNFGDHALWEDVNNLGRFPLADVIIGGPPCQGFSNLGSHIENDPRNQLWRHFVRAVEQVRPLAFVVENVPPLLKSEEGQELIRETKALGYDVMGWILNAADYGAFQIRKRTIIIGSRVGSAVCPKQTHADPGKIDASLNLDGLSSWRTVREAFDGLSKEPDGKNLHVGRNPTAKSVRRYKCIPTGGNRWDLPLELMPPCWIKKTQGGTDLFGRLWWERPSVTIRTEFYKPEKGRYLHPEEDRPITHREAARLQGFPDSFEFAGSRTSIARQIGNAVPVQLAEAIAHTVLEVIDNGKKMEVG